MTFWQRIKWKIVVYLVGERMCVINAHFSGLRGLTLGEGGCVYNSSVVDVGAASIGREAEDFLDDFHRGLTGEEM